MDREQEKLNSANSKREAGQLKVNEEQRIRDVGY
jgi:hypothetical protein